jgi:hypothetical protein
LGQQQSVMVEKPELGSNLNSEQIKKLKIIMDSSDVYDDFPIFVEIKEVRNTQVEGTLKLFLPSTACKNSTFSSKRVEYNSETNYLWYGMNDQDIDSCSNATLLLISKNNAKYGSLVLGDEHYDIHDLGGVNVLNRIKFEDGILDCGTESGSAEPSSELGVLADDCADVRLLVLYTSHAYFTIDDMPSFVDTKVEQLKSTLLNSAIPKFDLNIKLVGLEQIAYVENVGVKVDFQDIRKDKYIKKLREKYLADIVVVLGQYEVSTGQGMSDAYGITSDPNNPNSDGAIALVSLIGADVRAAFTHEIGHMFGAGHQTGDDTRPGIPHAYCVKKHYTTMYGNLDSDEAKKIIPYFSNPYVKYKKAATGTSKENYNASIIKSFTCQVSNYFSEPVSTPFSVSFGGNYVACPCAYVNLTAAVSGNFTPPVSYMWEKSTDGINWVPASGFTSFTAAVSCTDGVTSYVRVTATSSDFKKKIATYTHPINANSNLCFIKNKVYVTTNVVPSIDITMSNIDNDYSLNIESNVDQIIDYQITTIDGKPIKSVKQKIVMGNNELDLQTNDLIVGIYIITIQNENIKYSNKFIINKN